jgi:hypothetical protein
LVDQCDMCNLCDMCPLSHIVTPCIIICIIEGYLEEKFNKGVVGGEILVPRPLASAKTSSFGLPGVAHPSDVTDPDCRSKVPVCDDVCETVLLKVVVADLFDEGIGVMGGHLALKVSSDRRKEIIEKIDRQNVFRVN